MRIRRSSRGRTRPLLVDPTPDETGRDGTAPSGTGGCERKNTTAMPRPLHTCTRIVSHPSTAGLVVRTGIRRAPRMLSSRLVSLCLIPSCPATSLLAPPAAVLPCRPAMATVATQPMHHAKHLLDILLDRTWSGDGLLALR